MPKVAVIFKVYPDDGKLEQVMKKVNEKLKPAAMQSEEVAFGIKVVKVRFVFDDSETSSSKIEENIKAVEGVSEVEVEEESLI
jgi:translation elongation factor EF-1beta